MVLAALPAGYVQVSVGGTGYYYYDGVYFRPVASLSSGFEVVAPPTGVVVPKVPTGAELVTVVDNAYYYAGGAFYMQQPSGFAVVPAPLGAVVNTPPLGAIAVTVNGAVCFQAANGFYQPVLLRRNHPNCPQPHFHQLRPSRYRKLGAPQPKRMPALGIQMHLHRNVCVLQRNIVNQRVVYIVHVVILRL